MKNKGIKVKISCVFNNIILATSIKFNLLCTKVTPKNFKTLKQ